MSSSSPKSSSFSIPCSTSNIGPGFDCFGLALSLYMHCKITRLHKIQSPPQSESIHFHFSGFHAEKLTKYHSDGKNIILDTIHRVLQEEGITELSHAYDICINNEIPIGSGLGSSGVSVIAGIKCAQFIAQKDWHRERDLIPRALRIEGHPDNVTPSIAGGFISSVTLSDGHSTKVVHHTSHPYDKRIRILIVTPDLDISTQEARAILPKQVSLKDAVFNMQRAVALPSIFSPTFREQHENFHERQRIFSHVLADRWHQTFRAEIMPGVGEVLSLEMPGLLASGLSGAGPSVISFVDCEDEEQADKIQRAVEMCFTEHNVGIVKSCFVEVDYRGCCEILGLDK